MEESGLRFFLFEIVKTDSRRIESDASLGVGHVGVGRRVTCDWIASTHFEEMVQEESYCLKAAPYACLRSEYRHLLSHMIPNCVLESKTVNLFILETVVLSDQKVKVTVRIDQG